MSTDQARAMRYWLNVYDQQEDETGRAEAAQELATLAAKLISQDSTFATDKPSFPASPTVRAALERAENAVTVAGKLRAVSRLEALVSLWMVQLVGRALADPEGPSWGEIGKSLSKVDKRGNVVLAPVTRQAARQRFSAFLVVEKFRLEGVVANLERSLSTDWRRVRAVLLDPKRNRAEKRRDALAIDERIGTSTGLLEETREKLDAINQQLSNGSR